MSLKKFTFYPFENKEGSTYIIQGVEFADKKTQALLKGLGGVWNKNSQGWCISTKHETALMALGAVKGTTTKSQASEITEDRKVDLELNALIKKMTLENKKKLISLIQQNGLVAELEKSPQETSSLETLI